MSASRSMRTTLIVVGGTVFVGIVGWFGNYIAARYENARLITSLQIQREEAETTLRGDIFDQTMKAFLDEAKTLENRSKQLLQLELLALNFGDTVSLGPLFQEFRRDLILDEDNLMEQGMTIANPAGSDSALGPEPDLDNERDLIRLYRKRLRSLAKRVASRQLSALAMHGATTEKPIEIGYFGTPSTLSLDDGDSSGAGRSSARADEFRGIFEEFNNGVKEFEWPRDEVLGEFAETLETWEYHKKEVSNCSPVSWWRKTPQNEACALDEPELSGTQELLDAIDAQMRRRGCLDIGHAPRQVEMIVSRPDLHRRSIEVQLKIYRTESCRPDQVAPKGELLVERQFTLDYYNFPTIDNTRLPDNQRFALVLEGFNENHDTGSEVGGIITMAVVVFPSEYASLSDRPGLKEAVHMMEEAIDASR